MIWAHSITVEAADRYHSPTSHAELVWPAADPAFDELFGTELYAVRRKSYEAAFYVGHPNSQGNTGARDVVHIAWRGCAAEAYQASSPPRSARPATHETGGGRAKAVARRLDRSSIFAAKVGELANSGRSAFQSTEHAPEKPHASGTLGLGARAVDREPTAGR